MIRKLIASWFFVGYFPIASGTAGSFAASVVGIALVLLLGSTAAGIALLALSVVLFIAGMPLGTWAEAHYGRKDPSPFVLDEVVGSYVALAPVLLFFPGMCARADILLGIVPAFALPFFFFRLFDVIKPYPANRAELLHGGLGIMLDDVIAGVYAAGAAVSGVLLFFR